MLETENNQYTINKITSDKYTDKDWQEYFEFRKTCGELLKIEFSIDTWEKLKENSLEFLDQGNGIYTVKKDENPVGYFFFDKGYEDQPELKHVYLTPYFGDEAVDHELIKLILRAYLEFHPNHGFLVIASKDGSQDYIGEMVKAGMASNQIYYELRKDCVNKEVVEEWIETYSSKFPNLKMKFYEEIPTELVEEFCLVFTELLLDMPANSEMADPHIIPEKFLIDQENDREDNYTSYRYLIFNEQNKLIAKTNVAINKNDPKSMHQYMTGVIKEYRGLGLGKWLKGAMWQKLTADFPELEKITTETHPENHGSKSISLQMGFQQTATMKEFKVTREMAKAFIEG